MRTPEQRSDELDKTIHQLDQKVVALPAADLTARLFIAVGVVVIAVAFTAQFVILYQLNRSNRDVLTAQIPGLKSQIHQRDKTIVKRDQTIADQGVVLEQAVDAITRLAKQVQALGGDPGTIELKPPKHP